jgi:hypothetical protein
MSATLYAGPGKLYMGTTALWPEGENGSLMATINQAQDEVASAMFGRQSSTQGDGTATIKLTPLDNWGALGLLFPAFIGVKVGATAAALKVGTRPHNPAGGSDVPAKIWTPDARLYSFPRCAVTKHPDLHLGVGKALFGDVEVTAIGATGKAMGDAGFLHTITESGAADPGGQMTMADFERGEWTGIYGTIAGFGGDGGAAIEAEEEWTITSQVKYSPLPVQKLTRAFKLDSVEFMVKVRPYGPTHTNIDAAIGLNNGRLLGSRFASGSAVDLVLTGPGAKTITLKNADVVGAGFEFGGTKLGTGEIGFVTGMTFTAGVAGSLLEFSA